MKVPFFQRKQKERKPTEFEEKEEAAQEELKHAKKRLTEIDNYLEGLPHVEVSSDLDQMIDEQNKLSSRLPELEDKAHRRRVDRLTLEYGKDSVKLTKKNIRISLWVPVLTFLLGTVPVRERLSGGMVVGRSAQLVGVGGRTGDREPWMFAG